MGGMKLGLGVLLILAACGDSGGSSDSQTDSGGSESQTGTTGTTGGSQSGGVTEGPSGVSDSQTGEPTTAPTSVPQDTDDTTADDTAETHDTDDTTQGVSVSDTDDTSTGPGGEDSTTGGTTSTTEPDCVPAEEVCNDLDDDCDGIVDDVDVGMDGVCDCLSIALIGDQGSNPSSEFQQYLEDLGTTTVRLSSAVLNDYDAPITALTLQPHDIVILDYLKRSYSADEATAVRQWVEAGGGMMAMTGFADVQIVADRPNSILSTMGLSYNTSKSFFNGPVTQFAVHPITEGLTSVSFYGGLFIDMIDDGVGANSTIMTLQQGPVGVVQQRQMGRVFVFGDEWVEFDSEWQNIPQIKQFWVQTLSWLGPQDSCTVPQ